eukprot:TRINITY_DN103_c0_g1_i5.p1 TRINITY_DN103_c0_g1~~TRINITY_DN103_c0_g1_i5.p1  ORF type:complete len:219 (-),score=12.31 TRINITY_DN103_c0_g1_i5:27-683(-)
MAAPTGSFLPAGGLLVVLCVVALSLQSVQAVNATSLLSVVDYSPDHVSYSGNTVTIKIDPQAGSRVHSINRYAYGVFSAEIKCPAGDTKGLVPTFYTSSLEGSDDKDELDFEFLGKNSLVVPTNYNSLSDGLMSKLQLGRPVLTLSFPFATARLRVPRQEQLGRANKLQQSFRWPNEQASTWETSPDLNLPFCNSSTSSSWARTAWSCQQTTTVFPMA